MADIIMHESVLSIATEGRFFGDSAIDVRYPHWPGFDSGVTIGLGFDIGASKISAENLEIMLSSIGVPDGMIKELAKTILITGVKADMKLKELKLREKVKLTQQQTVDIMVLVNQNYKAVVKNSFSASYNTTHPAVIEALNKIAYGAPTLLSGWAPEKFAGLGPLFDAKLATISEPINQCDFFIEMMNYMRNFPWKSESIKEIHGNRVTKAMSSFILKIKDHLKKGDKVVIQKGPVNIDELLRPENKTFEFSVDVSNKLTGYNIDAIDFKNEIKTAREKEPVEMKKFCAKHNYTMPVISGTQLTESSMSDFRMMMLGNDPFTKKAQIILVNLGYYKKAGISGGMANADGVWGTNSETALKIYQKDNKIRESGKLDKETKALMFGNSENNSYDFIKPMVETFDSVIDYFKKIPEQLIDSVESLKHSVDFLAVYQGGTASISNSVGEGAVNKGKDVAVIKGLLCREGYYHLDLIQTAVNLFSSAGLEQVNKELINAIYSYQKDKKLSFIDGRIDPDGDTLKSLNGHNIIINEQDKDPKQNSESSQNEIKVTQKPNEQIKKIQAILIKEGLLQLTYFSVITNGQVASDDGIWGELTARAMYKFQQKYKLKTDGKLNTETIEFIKQNYGKTKKDEHLIVAESIPGSGFYPCFN